MSKINTSNPNNSSRERWCSEQKIFGALERYRWLGALSIRQTIAFGASYAVALIGPDVYLLGSDSNQPTSGGYPWDMTGTIFSSGPSTPFTQDTQTWVRGHLINGEWGGPGGNWKNLTPLTATANANHKTIEQYMKSYLKSSLSFEREKKPPNWYALLYAVQCSKDSFATKPAKNVLYSYAPKFIRVTWRAVEIEKPKGVPIETAQSDPASKGVQSATDIPFQITRPRNLPANGLPANQPEDQVLGNLGEIKPYGSLFQTRCNAFDGEIDIHQS